MRRTWKGSIEIGLLNVPEVSMYSAIEAREKVSFRQLHREKTVKGDDGKEKKVPCRCRLQQKMFCPVCDKEILDKNVEIIKGYETGKDTYITLAQEEIDSCKKESTETIKILQFVDDGEIPAIYHESAMFLSASKTGVATFGLVCQVLSSLNKVAIGKVVIRAKDHFLAIKPYEGVLIAYDLYFPNEIRDTTELQNPKFQESLFDTETMELAKRLILKMSKPFNPEEIKDEYTEGLKEIISAKADGKVVSIAEVKEARAALSLQDALKGSLADAVNF